MSGSQKTMPDHNKMNENGIQKKYPGRSLPSRYHQAMSRTRAIPAKMEG